MPIGQYFNGGGEDVMKNMAQQYGSKKGKQVFYATANKRKAKPSRSVGKSALGKTLTSAIKP